MKLKGRKPWLTLGRDIVVRSEEGVATGSLEPRWQGVWFPTSLPTRKQEAELRQEAGTFYKTFRPTSSDPLPPIGQRSKDWGPGVHTHEPMGASHTKAWHGDAWLVSSYSRSALSGVHFLLWECAFSGCPATGYTSPDFYLTPTSQVTVACRLFCF